MYKMEWNYVCRNSWIAQLITVICVDKEFSIFKNSYEYITYIRIFT